jgi:hypothetical protein
MGKGVLLRWNKEKATLKVNWYPLGHVNELQSPGFGGGLHMTGRGRMKKV